MQKMQEFKQRLVFFSSAMSNSFHFSCLVSQIWKYLELQSLPLLSKNASFLFAYGFLLSFNFYRNGVREQHVFNGTFHKIFQIIYYKLIVKLLGV